MHAKAVGKEGETGRNFPFFFLSSLDATRTRVKLPSTIAQTREAAEYESDSGARERSSVTISQFSSCVVAESGVHSSPRSVFRKPQFSHPFSVILILSNYRKCMREIKVF